MPFASKVALELHVMVSVIGAMAPELSSASSATYLAIESAETCFGYQPSVTVMLNRDGVSSGRVVLMPAVRQLSIGLQPFGRQHERRANSCSRIRFTRAACGQHAEQHDCGGSTTPGTDAGASEAAAVEPHHPVDLSWLSG